MGKKKNNFRAAIVLMIFISIVIFGVVSISYGSLTENQTTHSTQNEDENNFFYTYMKSIYDRLQYGTK